MSECRCRSVNLTEWAKTQGVHPQTAYRWFREGTLPVPAQRVGPRTILVNIDANARPEAIGGLGLYARVSSHDQKTDLERQVEPGSLGQARTLAARLRGLLPRLECHILAELGARQQDHQV